MKMLAVLLSLLLGAASLRAAPEPAPAAANDAAARDLQAIRDFVAGVRLPEGSQLTPLETHQRFENAYRRLRELGLQFLQDHPADPRRWFVVDMFNPEGPQFIKDWGPLDEDGRPVRPVVDAAAAAEWKAQVAALKAEMAKATDIPAELSKEWAERAANREKMQARMQARQDEFRTRARAGRVAPEFPMTDLAGNPVRLADFAGKVVVLDFWATWCGPCLAAMPHTEAIAAKYADQGVVVLASCTGDTRANFEKWVRTNAAKYPHIVWAFDPLERSPERASVRLYEVAGIPAQFVIDRHGRVVDGVLGYRPGETLLEDGLARAGVAIPARPPAGH